MWYNCYVERVVFISNVSPTSFCIWKDGGTMFSVNDTIMYGTQGVCKIVEITEKDFMGAKKEYYVLKPMNDKGATLFAPVTAKDSGKMRRILSKEEIYELVNGMPKEDTSWIKNDNLRKETYKRTIAEGDHTKLIKMICDLYAHREEREAAGKHLYLSDERFLKEAERILCDEFTYVLNLKKDEVLTFVFKK